MYIADMPRQRKIVSAPGTPRKRGRPRKQSPTSPPNIPLIADKQEIDIKDKPKDKFDQSISFILFSN